MNTVYATVDGTYETLPYKSLVSWRSVLGGFVLSLMTFAGLMALALAFGGSGLSDGSTVQNAGIFAGIAVIAATVIAIFVGSYFSVRLSRQKIDVVGCSQGLVLGSLVVLFVMWITMSAVGTIGRAAAEATGAAAVAAGTTAGAAAQNPLVQDMVEDALGTTNLKSDPSVVVRGVSTRLVRGDQEGAKNYLAYQAGITREEADAKIAAMKTKADELMVKARTASANAMKASGWSVFLLIALSAIASVLGGLLASVVNVRGTLDSHNEITTPKRASPKTFERTFDKPART